ncbi:MAG: protein kinase [Sideroxydans sp.]|nr:protein kinase [Sideroxydans sp.]
MVTPTQIGKYQIQGELGKGGMGVVWRGWDAAIARAVAIKCIDKRSYQGTELDELLQRFRQEAQVVGRLVHPRIVQIYDYFEDEQGAYIVMELVHGKPLSQHLAQGDVYEIHEVGQIIAQILDGIGYAHGHKVVHRDIKPSNILINNDGRIKINDFGIAHVEASTLTQMGDLLGTPHYMSPEQFLGKEITPLVDLFAIAVIAYELLTRNRPFTGNVATIMQQVLAVDPVKPSLLNMRLSASMDAVLGKALSKKPEDRYASAREFSDAFKQAVRDSISPEVTVSSLAAQAFDGNALLNVAQAMNTIKIKAEALTADDDSGTISLDTSVKKARLLIVDDEERILTALKSLFRERYHVFTTTDGNKALEFLRKYQMHVIISDQRMPLMLGVDLLRRSREISPRSVRILLTGYSDLSAIVGSINDGEVYRFINKPWDNAALHSVVAEAVTIALELADTKSAAVALPDKMTAAVLVIAPDEDIFRVARELLGTRCPVLYAADSEDAMLILQQQEVAVVLADVEASQIELTSMLKLLKQETPQILTIVTTKKADSELVIELINQAQVFRILSKPINVALLKEHIHAALQRYLSYKQTPKLLRSHKVQAVAEVRESHLGVRILDNLKLFRGKWFGAA